MNKFILFLSVALAAVVSGCGSQNNAYESFAEHFGETAAFAYAHVGNSDVLLVSHEVFGDDESEGLQAIATSIFALDPEGKIVSLGSIRSQGTLYPVSLIDNKLMVAGHCFVTTYDIRGEVPELVLVSHEEGDCESPQLAALFETFQRATPIEFSCNPEQ